MTPSSDPPLAEKRRTVPCYCDRRHHALRVLGLPSLKVQALRERLDAQRFARKFGAIEFSNERTA